MGLPLRPSSRVRRSLTIAVAVLIVAAFVSGRRATAQCGPNPIVCENQLTGTVQSTWDVSGAGDGSLQGFTTAISVNVGETVTFKIDTTAATYNMDIYRMGYYGGRGARKIGSTITGIGGQNQPNCVSNGSTGLLDCGNWAESVSWAVPTTSVSGIYFARLRRPDTGGASHVVFVVRDDAAASDLLFQTSDTTWQAYNQYGGNSFYVGSPAGRAYKVELQPSVHDAWNESGRLGIQRRVSDGPVDRGERLRRELHTGVDTDRTRRRRASPSRLFLSVGHDEYWSGRAARERRGGAGAQACTSHSSAATRCSGRRGGSRASMGRNTPYRTLVTYKETHANAKIDPRSTDVDRHLARQALQSAGRRRPSGERADGHDLHGELLQADATIRVTGAYRSQPFWRNTRVASLSATGSTTLTPGMLNYEWDEDLNNGSRPAGLMRLSATP